MATNNRKSRRQHVRVAESSSPPTIQPTGEQPVREESSLLCDRLTRRLVELSQDNPSLPQVVQTTSTLRELA
jgi:hypothetical protein